MLKVHTFESMGENQNFIICDFCGEGIGVVSPQEDIDALVAEHTNCTKLQNTDLAFLATDPEYIP